MLRAIRSLITSTSAYSDADEDADENSRRWRVGYVPDGVDDTEGGAFWPIRPQPRRRPLSGAGRGEEEDGHVTPVGDGVVQQLPYHPQNTDAGGDRAEEREGAFEYEEEGDYNAFAPQPDDFPEMQPFIGLSEAEENELAFRHRVGLTIIAVSVVFNLCNPLFFIAGILVPVFSYINIDGKKSMVYLVGEAVGEVGIFSGQLRRVDHCLTRYFDSASLGLLIGAILLVLALFAALRAFKWTTGMKRFMRPFLFSGASLGGGIASFFVVRGYSTACNGAFLWYHAEPGLYYIVFGTALTVVHTLVLYAQVSRYPLRTSTPNEAIEMPQVEAPAGDENRVLMFVAVGEQQLEQGLRDQQQPPEHHDDD